MFAAATSSIFKHIIKPSTFSCRSINLEASQCSHLHPSNEFVSGLPVGEKDNLKKSLEELEIFAYMGTFVPQSMTDDDWTKTLNLKTVKEKVDFWEYVALTQKRKEYKEKRKSKKTEMFDEWMAEQRVKYEAGEMGYGPNLYSLISNPFRHQKHQNHISGSRIFHAMQVGAPRIAFDLQYLNSMPRKVSEELGNHVQYAISENFSSKTAFQMSFHNVAGENEEWLDRRVGFYSSNYNHQTILPDVYRKGIKESIGGEIVYISRYAKEVLDGPLKADVYALAVTKDFKQESLGAARRAKIRAMRLPFHRYVKWTSGAQVLPFPNLVNVLREVYASGGDWQTALLNNIAKRHLTPNDDERKEVARQKKKLRDQERRELLEAIMNATGR